MSNSALFSVLNQVEVGSSKFARADYMNAGYPGAFNKKIRRKFALPVREEPHIRSDLKFKLQIVTLIINLLEITLKS